MRLGRRFSPFCSPYLLIPFENSTEKSVEIWIDNGNMFILNNKSLVNIIKINYRLRKYECF